MFYLYRLINRLFRPQAHQRELATFVANFQVAKNMLAGALPKWNNPTHPPHMDRQIPLSELFQEKDRYARLELTRFLTKVLALDMNQVRVLYEEVRRSRLKDIDIDSLRGALIQFVPLAVTGKERKISTLLRQGVALSTSARTYYIQRDISETIGGIGSADRDLEGHQVITLADYLLLKYLIETLVQHYEEEGAVWFRETTWYYACVFGFWVQHAEENNIGGKYYELFMSGIRPSPHDEMP